MGSLLYGLFWVMRVGSSLARLDKPLFDFTMLGAHDVTVDTHLHQTCVTVHLNALRRISLVMVWTFNWIRLVR